MRSRRRARPSIHGVTRSIVGTTPSFRGAARSRSRVARFRDGAPREHIGATREYIGTMPEHVGPTPEHIDETRELHGAIRKVIGPSGEAHGFIGELHGSGSQHDGAGDESTCICDFLDDATVRSYRFARNIIDASRCSIDFSLSSISAGICTNAFLSAPTASSAAPMIFPLRSHFLCQKCLVLSETYGPTQRRGPLLPREGQPGADSLGCMTPSSFARARRRLTGAIWTSTPARRSSSIPSSV
jgi:hypothetical protein